MKNNIFTGIDIGTYQTKVVIASPAENADMPMHILGSSTAASKGLRHGFITDTREVSRSIKEALQRASAMAKVPVTSAYVAAGGMGLDEVRSTGEVSLTASGGIVTERDIDRAQQDSLKRASSKLINRKHLHIIPLEYRIDGTRIFNNKPQGLQGTKMTVDTLIITLLTQHYDDIVEAVEGAHVEVEDVLASPLAASLVTLTKAQKTAGVVLANIGAETLSIVVFDNDLPVSLKVFPTGSSDITNTLALSFQLPLTEAEQLKRGVSIGTDVSPRKVQQIIATRLKDLFTIINAHLKSIGRERLLPAGIVVTGGGSSIATTLDVARAILKLPSQIGSVGHFPRTASVDATWAVAYGLCRWGYAESAMAPTHTPWEVVKASWEFIKQTARSLIP